MMLAMRVTGPFGFWTLSNQVQLSCCGFDVGDDMT
jgi:hypothetical protein